MSDPYAPLKERAWREVAEIDQRLERGEIDEEEWHRAMAGLVVPAYLAAGTPWGQSGKSGDEANWEVSRRPVVAAIDRDGTFLDVGCANGFLMESVKRWAAEDGHRVEPYGLDISAELAQLARRRLPEWADRIFVGNALDWDAPLRFDFVRTGLDYAPPARRRNLVEHLLANVVRPGGRLIVGVFNEERDGRPTEELVASWGYQIAGRLDTPHRDPRIVYRVFWIDAAADWSR